MSQCRKCMISTIFLKWQLCYFMAWLLYLQIRAAMCKLSLQWRHNGRDSVSNHQPHDCLLKRLFNADQRKHQSSASLAFVRGIHRGPVNSPRKWPVTRKMFPFDDAIMWRNGPRFNRKMLSCQCRKSYCGDKIVVRSTQWDFLYW